MKKKTADFQVEMLPLKRAHITLEVLLFFYIRKQKNKLRPIYCSRLLFII